MSELPSMRVLGYMAGRPRIRLVHLPQGVVETSPVMLNGSGYAFDAALRREGWIAFWGFVPWGLPIPFGEPAFKIGHSFGFEPSEKPRAIWLEQRSTAADGAMTYSEFDGVTRAVIDRFDLPPFNRAIEFFRSGVVVRRDDGTEWLWERNGDKWEQTTLAELPSRPGEKRLIRTSDGALTIVDDRGARVDVEAIDGEPMRGSFSPDGRYLALDLDLRDRTAPISSMAEIAQGVVRYEPVPHRLAVIDCGNGAATVASAVYDNFASPFVWSSDSRSLVFATPFSPHGIWAYSVADMDLTWISFGRRHAPGPLVDVSDLIPPATVPD